MKKEWKQVVYAAFLLLIASGANAQQFSVDNQYTINRFSQSPAYAGFNGNIEAFVGYRQEWFGIEGAPQKQYVSINGPSISSTGFGVSLENLQTGNFTHFTGKFSYAYHLELGTGHNLSFGIAAEVYRNQLEGRLVNSSGQDPVLLNLQVLNGTTFNASAGVLYRLNNLNFGIVAPRMLPMTITYYEGYQYQMAQEFMVHASYAQPFGNFVIEPLVSARSTMNTWLFEASVMAHFKDRAWVSAGYRKGNTFMVNTGVALSDEIVINYSYEFGSGNMLALSSGTHEISIGFMMKRFEGNDQIYPTIFPPKSQEESQNQQIAEETQKKIEELNNLYEDEKEKRKKQIDSLKDAIAQMDTSEKDDEQKKPQWSSPFILKNIKFAKNSDRLFSSSFAALNRLAIRMQKDQGLVVKITGHTDNEGSSRYNKRLSENRARSVKNYLVQRRNIDEGRISIEGKGESDPKASNATEAGRAQNRRIEVRFKKTK